MHVAAFPSRMPVKTEAETSPATKGTMTWESNGVKVVFVHSGGSCPCPNKHFQCVTCTAAKEGAWGGEEINHGSCEFSLTRFNYSRSRVSGQICQTSFTNVCVTLATAVALLAVSVTLVDLVLTKSPWFPQYKASTALTLKYRRDNMTKHITSHSR